ncbi:hypothetical protein ACIREE_21830 [Streptomyces sp. NPDC102467]|uniref:hypothetical protein n=1 Tax=Streptomyces sp. NPDC102467 TaxID=3366179 RepID=UPI0037FA78D9
MERKQIWLVTATLTVFAWSVAMVAMGQVAAIAALAPALGLTVQQITRAARHHNTPASGHRVTASPHEKEDGAP